MLCDSMPVSVGMAVSEASHASAGLRSESVRVAFGSVSEPPRAESGDNTGREVSLFSDSVILSDPNFIKSF